MKDSQKKATLENKIDFAVVISVKNANPNGDPLTGNRPRETYDGYGEISDVCIKRKIRNQLQFSGESIFVQSKEMSDCESLKQRVEKCEELKAAGKDKKKYYEAACKKWIDVRSFGQIFLNKDPVSIRGPVSITQATSVSPIEIVSMQITRSIKDDTDRGTMGLKHKIPFGLYVFYGSISCQLAEKTGFTEEDAEKIKNAILHMFDEDSSSARPGGSMEVCRLYWWKHDCKTPKYSSAKVHRLLSIKEKEGVSRPESIDDYDITLGELDGLSVEKYEDLT